MAEALTIIDKTGSTWNPAKCLPMPHFKEKRFYQHILSNTLWTRNSIHCSNLQP